MTALADIRKGIAQVQLERQTAPLPFMGRHPPMKVLLGESAYRAVVAEVTDCQLPREIDGVPVERTNFFPGYLVTGRPAAMGGDPDLSAA